MSLSDDQIANLFQSLLNAEQRLKAIEAELVVARRNEQTLLAGQQNLDDWLTAIDQCLIDNDMAYRNPPQLVVAASDEVPTLPSCNVHHFSPKEPA